MKQPYGKWHGDTYYFGLHYDLHAQAKDQELGSRCDPEELRPMIERMDVDFVQCDCKGHAGYVSWFSETPGAALPPGLQHDALAKWRETTRQLGLPLHCHYSGIWDRAAGASHPEWAVVGPEGKATGAPFGQNAGAPTGERMCPRSGYLETLMLPQLLELIDRYGVDGFWIDGDLWAAEPCYCDRCREAFTAETGLAEPPVECSDARWFDWWDFTRRSFEAYVTRYCEAVHRHRAGVLVCSNWLQTYRNPGEPTVPTDWISGDNSWVFGLDGSRCEARFLSTRRKPWDIMLWGFYCSHGMGQADSPWVAKPPQMLMQEAAVLLTFGGNVQVYENTNGLRDGRLVPWRQARFGEVSRFIKLRRSICQGSETIPQIAVLHSEHHLRRTASGRNLMWNLDPAPVSGATFSLLENSFGVDILDEWALLARYAQFPVIVAPEQDMMSDEMVEKLRRYVRQGGKLLVTGPAAIARFGAEFLGIACEEITEAGATFHLPAADGMVPLHSKPWAKITATTAEQLLPIGTSQLTDDRLLPFAGATLHAVGDGQVLYVPANLFRDFEHNHYPLTRRLVGELVRRLAGEQVIEVEAPACIDVALRRKGKQRYIHLVNRLSGLPTTPKNGAIDEIPPVGPVTMRLRQGQEPDDVQLMLESGRLDWHHKDGVTTITLGSVHIHAAIAIS